MFFVLDVLKVLLAGACRLCPSSLPFLSSIRSLSEYKTEKKLWLMGKRRSVTRPHLRPLSGDEL